MDIRIKTDIWTHPKTIKLQRRLGAEGVIALIRLWCWCADARPDGVLRGMDAEDIEIAAGWCGECGVFAAALVELRWIDEPDPNAGRPMTLHDWRQHNPWAAGAESRSDKARLSALALRYPELYKRYIEDGKTAITKSEYEAAIIEYSLETTAGAEQMNRQRSASESPANASDTSAPSPSPVPSPEPKNESQGYPHSYTQGYAQSYTQSDISAISTITGLPHHEITAIIGQYQHISTAAIIKLIEWVQDKNIRVKNWRAYITKWAKKNAVIT